MCIRDRAYTMETYINLKVTNKLFVVLASLTKKQMYASDVKARFDKYWTLSLLGRKLLQLFYAQNVKRLIINYT